jgi:hypothetical protein
MISTRIAQSTMMLRIVIPGQPNGSALLRRPMAGSRLNPEAEGTDARQRPK